MKKEDIKVGAVYRAKVTNKLADVRITHQNPNGGWDAVNLATKRSVRIMTAGRLRAPVPTAGHTAPAKKTPKKQSLIAAALLVMKGDSAGKGMSAKQIAQEAIEKKLWEGQGKTPGATLYSAIIREIATKGTASRFCKVGAGRFALAQ